MSTENNEEPKSEEQNKEEKTYSESEFKKLVSQRDELKKSQNTLQADLDKIKAQIKTAEDNDLKNKGELQTLLDNKEKELAETKTKAADAETYKQKYEDLDKSLREKHLSQLEDEELKEIAESLPTDKLIKFVEKNKSNTPGTDSSRPGGKGKINIDGKKWNDFPVAELELLKTTDSQGYAKLFRERYGVNPSA